MIFIRKKKPEEEKPKLERVLYTDSYFGPLAEGALLDEQGDYIKIAKQSYGHKWLHKSDVIFVDRNKE